MPSESNKRIAKNTIYLYIRMLITMVVTLYTSRVVLQTLGVDDFGIYNIIGGIVVLFSILNHAMSVASQRFISYEIGKGDKERLRNTFNMSMNCHVIIALILIVLAETVGLWFVNNKLNIPEGRMYATQWVYQFSILTFIIGILRVPYNATIISYEKMSFYAYISIVEVLLKLGVVYLLLVSPIDKLITYSALIFLVSLLCWFGYIIYCRIKFDICKLKLYWNGCMFKELMGFTGWSVLSGGSVMITQQGSNVLINIFKGVSANAAYGIANQVSSAIYGFVSNFQMAFQPQIVKLYASGQREEQTSLILRTSTLSYFLLLLICVPFFINTDAIIGLWLGTVPEYSTSFCQWMLIYYLIDAIQGPLFMAIYATGNIKGYTLWLSALIILNLPLSWLALYLGMSPVFIFIIRSGINFLAAIIRLFYVKSFIKFPSGRYVKNFFEKVLPATIASFALAIALKPLFSDGLLSLAMNIVLSIIITLTCIYFLGLSSNDRQYIRSIIRTKLAHNAQ